MDREEDGKNADQAGNGRGNIVIISIMATIILFAVFMEAISFYSGTVANEVCGSKGYDKAVRHNLRSIYCVNWTNITFAGIENEMRQDDIFINMNGEWIIYESYQHGIGEIGRDELMS